MPQQLVTDPIYSIDLLPNGRLVVGGFAGVGIRDPNTGEQLHQFSPVVSRWSVATSPEGRYVAARHYDSGLYVFAADSGQQVIHLPGPSSAANLAFLPDAAQALVFVPHADRRLALLRLQTGQIQTLGGFNHSPGLVAVSSDGRHAVAVEQGAIGSRCLLFDLHTLGPIACPGGGQGITALAFPPAPHRYILAGTRAGALLRWDFTTGSRSGVPLQESTLPPGPDGVGAVRDIAVSPDGSMFAVRHDNRVVLWRWSDATASVAAQFEGVGGAVDEVARKTLLFSRDGRHVFAAGYQGVVKIAVADEHRENLRGPFHWLGSALPKRAALPFAPRTEGFGLVTELDWTERLTGLLQERASAARRLAEVDSAIQELASESICGQPDLQHVETYDGTLGVSREFVNTHEPRVGQVQWRGDIAAQFTGRGDNVGNVAGVRWGSGGLIGPDLFLSAGHCFDALDADWRTPRRGGELLPPAELAKLMQVNFNYQKNGTTGANRAGDSFPVEELIEHRVGGLDYAVIRLGRNAAGQYPGDVYGSLVVARVDLTTPGAMLCLIQHPQGQPKQIEAGPLLECLGSRISYASLDTLDGSSGSLILSASGEVVGVHTNGGCTRFGGSNVGVAIGAIRRVSTVL